jgi:hypothetical protein
MGFWKKLVGLIVPASKIAAEIWVKNPKSKAVVKGVEVAVDKVVPESEKEKL